MSKRPVSRKNRVHFFILLCHSFTWNWTNKNGKFCDQFLEKSWNFWAVSWNRDIGIKCWNCQFGRKKLKLAARGFAAAASFNFSGQTDSFNIYAKSRFHETAQKFNFFPKMVTKTAILLSSFKWNCAFTRFYAKNGPFLCPVSVKLW